MSTSRHSEEETKSQPEPEPVQYPPYNNQQANQYQTLKLYNWNCNRSIPANRIFINRLWIKNVIVKWVY